MQEQVSKQQDNGNLKLAEEKALQQQKISMLQEQNLKLEEQISNQHKQIDQQEAQIAELMDAASQKTNDEHEAKVPSQRSCCLMSW